MLPDGRRKEIKKREKIWVKKERKKRRKEKETQEEKKKFKENI